MNPNATSPKLSVLTILLSFMFLIACKHNTDDVQTYHIKVPTYISVNNARSLVSVAQFGRQLAVTGKIYTYGNYLFITEPKKGIHVVDNTNPSFPKFINFISIPGNVDMAINNDVLYADNYVDLLAFDISNPQHIVQVKRIDDTFDALYYSKGSDIIVAGYKDSVITGIQPVYYSAGINIAASSSSSQSQSYGTGGSTARFTLMNGYLYTVNLNTLKLFDVSQPSSPVFVNSINNIGFNVETIFPYQNKLFLGSTTGMQIYDASVPSAPVRLSIYSHFTSCDPVVVQGKYAYVTLRSGTTCQVGTNELDVLNIEDPAHPHLISATHMINPHGLTVTNNYLFVCEGASGLKAFSNADAINIGKNQLSFTEGLDAQDVIAGPKSLIVTGANGIYQYDYSDPVNLRPLSHITLAPQSL